MKELTKREKKITANQNRTEKLWYENGLIMLSIRDDGLYKEKYGTFEEYLSQRWDIARTRGHYLTVSAEFMQTALKDELGILFVVRDIQIRFRKPAKFDDVLNVDTRLLNVGRSLLEFEQNIYRGDEHLIAAKVEVVCIGAESFKPTSIPQEMLSQFKF